MNGLYIVLLGVEIIKYALGMLTFFNGKIIRKYAFPIAIGIYALTISLLDFQNVEKRLFLYLMVCILQIFTIELQKKSSKIIAIFVMVVGISCVDEIISDLIECVNYLCCLNIDMEKFGVLISSLITLVLLILSYILKKKVFCYGNKVYLFLKKNIRIFVVLVGIEIVLAIATLSYVKEIVNSKRFYVEITGICVFSFFCALILFMFTLYIEKTNQEIRQAMMNEKRLKKLQRDYYETLLEKEENTRKFRHELNHHLVCLAALAKEEDCEKVSEYIAMLQQKSVKIQKIQSTGNEIFDIFLNYYSGMILGECEIKVFGNCDKKIAMEDVDFSSVCSNLLENAMEELNKIGSNKKKFLYIKLVPSEYCLRCQIKNSMSKPMSLESIKKNGTSKKDKENHGIGLENVRNTIERNHGMFDIDIRENMFVCTMLLKIKKD